MSVFSAIQTSVININSRTLLNFNNHTDLKILGPYNASGDWPGVMGDVVTGKYPLSLNAWRWFPERNPILDFVPVARETYLLATIPKPQKVDFDLYIRPFTRKAWQAVIAFMIIGVTGLAGNQFIMIRYRTDLSRRIMMFSVWAFFVLCHAHYGGALKMFFTSDISLPFETIRDVLKRIPDWTITCVDGNEAVFKLKAEQVICYNHKV